MKPNTLATALLLAAALPVAAQAQSSPSNTWVEGSYVNVDGDADGHAVRGSFAFGQSGIYGLGAYSRIGVDDSPIRIDGWEAGLGYAHGLSDRTQLFAEATRLNTEVIRPSAPGAVDVFDARGYRSSLGLRSALGERFEGLVKANYTTGERVLGHEFSGTVGGLFKLGQTWGVSGDVTVGEEAETYQLGLRASF